MQSLFSRITRFGTRDSENRLTEAFASTLELVDGLAVDLARLWLDPAVTAAGEVAAATDRVFERLTDPTLTTCSVRTQVPTRSGKFVDLELRFTASGSRPADDILLWIEIKHGAPPHDGQLQSYLTDLDHRLEDTAVVLLAPREQLTYTDEDVPLGVPQRSWQATGRRASAHLRRARDELDPAQRWLGTQFCRYLREERLMDPEAIRPEHLVAFANMKTAETALHAVCRRAEEYITAHWGSCRECRPEPYSRTQAPGYGRGYWATYTETPSGLDIPEHWNNAWFDWNVTTSGGYPDRRGDLVFMAGLTRELKTEFVPQTDEGRGWMSRLQDDRAAVKFECFSGECYRLNRVAYPEEVLTGRTLEEQGDSLGKWVVETFEALMEAGPPPASTTAA